MLAKNSRTVIRWDNSQVAQREADRILSECQIEPSTENDRARARERIIMACVEYQFNELRKRAPLNRQAMMQAKILLDAITTLQTILPGSRWARQRRIETQEKDLPKGSRKRSPFRLLTNDINYNVEMLRYWRPYLRIEAARHAEVIGGYSFCPPEKFEMNGVEYTDWQGGAWTEHLAEQLDRLSAMVGEQYRRSNERRKILMDDKTKKAESKKSDKADPLRSQKPREQKTRGELAARENVSINNLIVQMENFWNAVDRQYAPLGRIDDLNPTYRDRTYKDRLAAGEQLPEGHRFMWLISQVCRSVGIGLSDNALLSRVYELRSKVTKIGQGAQPLV